MDVNYGYGLFTNSDPVIIPEPLQAGPGPFIGYWDSYTPAGEIPQLPLDGPRGWVRIAGNLLRSYDGYVRP